MPLLRRVAAKDGNDAVQHENRVYVIDKRGKWIRFCKYLGIAKAPLDFKI